MKKNNKGFTLVELIVVIAILGVLMAVLVPQYIQYVEKSRIGTDESTIGEIAHVMELASSGNETLTGVACTVNIEVESKTGTITVTTPADDGDDDAAHDAMLAEITDVIGSSVAFKSKAYGTGITAMTITLDANGKTQWLGYDQTTKEYTVKHGTGTVDASVDEVA